LIMPNACLDLAEPWHSHRSGRYRGTICKSPTTVSQVRILDLPPKPQVKPGARTGLSDVGERCRTPPVRPARAEAQPAASSKPPVTSQNARTPGPARRCQESEGPQDQLAVPNTCQRNLPRGDPAGAARERGWPVGPRWHGPVTRAPGAWGDHEPLAQARCRKRIVHISPILIGGLSGCMCARRGADRPVLGFGRVS
jgi:hypothetical protein